MTAKLEGTVLFSSGLLEIISMVYFLALSKDSFQQFFPVLIFHLSYVSAIVCAVAYLVNQPFPHSPTVFGSLALYHYFWAFWCLIGSFIPQNRAANIGICGHIFLGFICGLLFSNAVVMRCVKNHDVKISWFLRGVQFAMLGTFLLELFSAAYLLSSIFEFLREAYFGFGLVSAISLYISIVGFVAGLSLLFCFRPRSSSPLIYLCCSAYHCFWAFWCTIGSFIPANTAAVVGAVGHAVLWPVFGALALVGFFSVDTAKEKHF